MPETRHTAVSKPVKPGAANYLDWRGDLLAQLALARLPHATVFKPLADQGADYLVATDSGLCFFVQVQTFSSARRQLRSPSTVPELEWPVGQRILARARRSPTPVVLFLFDADTDHGRFLRLDTLPQVPAGPRQARVRFPIENTISRESLQRLVKELATTSAPVTPA